ncbi:hypothetical protein Micbo1qcDRAFT_56742 [Microdochium bolleyi]|uniref:Uncharacterized protein n=1 Tax=Microdochium bolleyi TaxID=196109 RepID=A0A136IKQ6_9PEZI|nr:hypothetical protein Micbo1qcDRAFT_56742 [Microdochium bolleyi]
MRTSAQPSRNGSLGKKRSALTTRAFGNLQKRHLMSLRTARALIPHRNQPSRHPASDQARRSSPQRIRVRNAVQRALAARCNHASRLVSSLESSLPRCLIGLTLQAVQAWTPSVLVPSCGHSCKVILRRRRRRRRRTTR